MSEVNFVIKFIFGFVLVMAIFILTFGGNGKAKKLARECWQATQSEKCFDYYGVKKTDVRL